MMRSDVQTTLCGGLFMLLGTMPLLSHAEHENYKEVGGVAIYIGIKPAEEIKNLHPGSHTERQMHGGVPHGAHRDHLVVALFDKATGQRITNAKVTATMREVGRSGETKPLEVMEIADTITWGNYFYLPNSEAYRVEVTIQRPGVPGVIEATFTHRHPAE